MSNYMTLLGAEDVARAARQIEGAASEIQRAASSIDTTLAQQRQWMDDWLMRFEQAIDKFKVSQS